ncbi:MAG TPA: IPT/TIG domain-containing protein, partial [Gammaproteobacteria bacterium]
MHLTDDNLYVTAEGYHFPYIDTPYEDQRVVLVYDREDRLPGGASEAKDRDVLYALPLNFTALPTLLDGDDGLLFAANAVDGVAVISIADPLKPTVVRIIREGVAEGVRVPLAATALQVVNGTLHVTGAAGRFIFDLAQPSLPQTAFNRITGIADAVRDRNALVAVGRSAAPVLYDVARGTHMRELGRYDGHGFQLPGSARTVQALTTLSSQSQADECGDKEIQNYLSIFDLSRPEEIGLLDALTLRDCGKATVNAAVLTDDGLWVGSTYANALDVPSELILLDTQVLDLVDSRPRNDDVGVPTGTAMELAFNRPLEIPAGETEGVYLARYLALLFDDGTDAGAAVPLTAALDANDARRVIVTPQSALQPNGTYLLTLSGELGSRRTRGLFDHEIRFQTASSNVPQPVITAVAPTIVLTSGGLVEVTVRHADAPAFLVGDAGATIQGSTAVDTEHTRYQLRVPADLAGPAALTVVNASGGRDRRIGAIQYVEPLHLDGLEPVQGSVNGGTRVTIRGAGFQPGMNRVAVYFDTVPADADSIRVLDANTVEVVTPAGRIGRADVRVELDTGQQAVLENAFDYQQPIQSNIRGAGRIYDASLDPTGTYAIVAAGSAGVAIYNVDASTFTANAEHPLNPDDLRRTIDLDADGKDDRIVSTVALPSGYVALGIDTYFERSSDRIFVTAAQLDGAGQPVADSARLFVIAFDPLDVTRTTLISALPLPGAFARGIEVENGLAVVAMGEAGLGLVDVFLHTKTYLTSRIALPGSQAALDVTRIDTAVGQPSRYAVVAGQYDIGQNRLLDALDRDSGGLYLIEQNAEQGMTVLGSVAVPASRVVVAGNYAYLASGEAGLVIVDIADPRQPRIVARVADAGAVFDVAVNGNTAYLAVGAAGILSVDVTDPTRPVTTPGIEAFPGNQIDVVLGGDYAGYGFGTVNTGGSIVQVAPDVVLKIHRIDPSNRILDYNATGELVVTLRFNKAIDLWTPNLGRFEVLGPDGQALNIDTTIVNNDALLRLRAPAPLQVGDSLTVIAHSGVESVKPLDAARSITLYRLLNDQRFSLTYRGARPDAVRLEAVVPRHIPQGRSQGITVSGLGIPADAARVRLFVADRQAEVTRIETNAANERVGIIHATVPAIVSAGLFDVRVQVERDGVWEQATLYGALMVDAPIHFDALSPAWGPVTGGSTVTITGRGFEPGNTVTNGLSIRIGSVPVGNLRVLSTERLEIVTRGGPVGRNEVVGTDRYGNEARLSGDAGFGYGLRRIAAQAGSNIFPSDVVVDQETGVAITTGGYLFQGYGLQTFGNVAFPDSVRAATFDIQDPNQPLLVGGVSALPSGEQGREAIARHIQLNAILAKDLLLGQPLTEEDKRLVEELQGSHIATSLDSIRLQAVTERDSDGVTRKRLYVANGSGGVARLNLDDQNGLQVQSQILDEDQGQHTSDVLKWGQSLFAARADVPEADETPDDPCQRIPGPLGESGAVERVNYSVPEDPVYLGSVADLRGGNVIAGDGEWLYSGGARNGWTWNASETCSQFRLISNNKIVDAPQGVITAVNLFDPVLTRQYVFDANILDIASYGDYLIVALGNGGVQIFHKEQPEERARLRIDNRLQAQAGRGVRLDIKGNLLFISADAGGLVVLDIAEPMNPYVVSAGNVEGIEATDIYKGRLIAASSGQGLSVFELPGALVLHGSVDEGGLIADDEDLVVTFNEPMTTESLQAAGAVQVLRRDTAAPVPVTVNAVDPVGGAATQYRL